MICEWFDLKTTRTIFSGLASKLVATIFSGFASKPVPQVSRFGHQNGQLQFDDLCLKITAMVSWCRLQNQAGFGLSVAPQNRRREDGVEQASKSGGLLRLEESHARFSSLASRLAEARRRVVHVAPSQRLHRD
jgi:hypothetical protein